MGKQELENLVRIGNLKAEPASKKEFDGMIASARRSLTDAQRVGRIGAEGVIRHFGDKDGGSRSALRTCRERKDPI